MSPEDRSSREPLARILRFLRWPVVSLLILVLLLLAALGPVAHFVFERALESALPTQVSIESVAPKFLVDSVDTGKISIFNPPNFGDGKAVILEGVHLSTSLRSLFRPSVEVDLLEIRRPRLIIETGSKKTEINFLALREEMRRRAAESLPSAADGLADSESPQRFKIQRIRLIEIHLELGEKLASEQAATAGGNGMDAGSGAQPETRRLIAVAQPRTVSMSDRWYSLEQIVERLFEEFLRIIGDHASELELHETLVAALPPSGPAGESHGRPTTDKSPALQSQVSD